MCFCCDKDSEAHSLWLFEQSFFLEIDTVPVVTKIVVFHPKSGMNQIFFHHTTESLNEGKNFITEN